MTSSTATSPSERALYYAAKMRLPEDFTEDQIRQRIDEVLSDVEMEERRSLLVSKLFRWSAQACFHRPGIAC